MELYLGGPFLVDRAIEPKSRFQPTPVKLSGRPELYTKATDGWIPARPAGTAIVMGTLALPVNGCTETETEFNVGI